MVRPKNVLYLYRNHINITSGNERSIEWSLFCIIAAIITHASLLHDPLHCAKTGRRWLLVKRWYVKCIVLQEKTSRWRRISSTLYALGVKCCLTVNKPLHMKGKVIVEMCKFRRWWFAISYNWFSCSV